MALSRNKQSAEPLPATLLRFFAARQVPNAPVPRLCVALSGGMDSVVLLHALRHLCISGSFSVELTALHVNHGLSPNADAWATFCTDFCRTCGVELEVVRVTVPRDSGEGLEGAARRMRRAVFANGIADWLALAHHGDDQAETVLLNLLRGAGVAGAAGMTAERPQTQGPTLIRPLLGLPRQVIEAYAVEHRLPWIDDESNADRHFRRNFLRHEILPLLEEKFPGAYASLGRAAGHFSEAAALLDELAAIDCAGLTNPSGRIGLAGFNALPPARSRNLLRHVWVSAGFRAPDSRWINEALSQLATADSLSETCLVTVDGELHVYRGELYFVEHLPMFAAEPLSWSGEIELPWAGGRIRFEFVSGNGIRREILERGGVSLRLRRGGERLRLHANRPRRNLRNLLQEAAIPPWKRARLPLLWCDDQLIWVGNLGVDVSFSCRQGEEGILVSWIDS